MHEFIIIYLTCESSGFFPRSRENLVIFKIQILFKARRNLFFGWYSKEILIDFNF